MHENLGCRKTCGCGTDSDAKGKDSLNSFFYVGSVKSWGLFLLYCCSKSVCAPEELLGDLVYASCRGVLPVNCWSGTDASTPEDIFPRSVCCGLLEQQVPRHSLCELHLCAAQLLCTPVPGKLILPRWHPCLHSSAVGGGGGAALAEPGNGRVSGTGVQQTLLLPILHLPRIMTSSSMWKCT